MNRMMRVVPAALAFALVIAVSAPALVASAADTTPMTMDQLKDAVKKGKKQLVADNMTLTAGEEAAFWPIYEAYQVDLDKINERTKKAILAYADAYNAGPIGDAQAKSLLAYYPLPNFTSSNYNYQIPLVGIADSDGLQTRINKTFSQKNSLNGGLGYQRTSNENPNFFHFTDGFAQDRGARGHLGEVDRTGGLGGRIGQRHLGDRARPVEEATGRDRGVGGLHAAYAVADRHQQR